MSEVDRFDKFITEGYIPFGKEKLRSENDVNDMETVGGGNKPSAFNSFITGDSYDDIEDSKLS